MKTDTLIHEKVTFFTGGGEAFETHLLKELESTADNNTIKSDNIISIKIFFIYLCY